MIRIGYLEYQGCLVLLTETILPNVLIYIDYLVTKFRLSYLYQTAARRAVFIASETQSVTPYYNVSRNTLCEVSDYYSRRKED